MRTNKSYEHNCRRFLCLILSLMMVFALAACGGGDQEPMRATEAVTSAPEVSTVSIETAYGTLAFPEKLQENMRHMEVTENDTAMEVFYMVSEAGEKEVFRIYFAAGQAGNHIGYLTTDSGEIPVSYSLCEYADKDFANEDERKLYYSMMDSFSVVMNSIHSDERFSETRAMAPVEDQTVKLRYWNVTLPQNIQFTETEENGNYRADFYGEVSGERVDLFTIGLGDLEGDTILGFYDVKGEWKPVIVDTYGMIDYELWPEEERSVINEMMGSINTVIEAIIEDKNFAEQEPGV